MGLTILGGLTFLGSQAWEWNTMINKEHVSITNNPFSSHIQAGEYLEGDGHSVHAGDTFEAGEPYLIHKHDGEWHNLKYKLLEGWPSRPSR